MSTPASSRRARPRSKALLALERALTDRSASSSRTRDDAAAELRRLAEALGALEALAGQDITSLIEDIAALTPAIDPAGRRGLTTAQESILRRTGSLVETMPPVAERASTTTALRRSSVLADSLTAGELARALGVTPSRIHQRATGRTVYAVRTPSGPRFPRFQLLDGAELPGWAIVVPHLPPGAHPMAVETFLHSPHVDLSLGGGSASPHRWLATGGNPSGWSTSYAQPSPPPEASRP